MKKNYLFSVVVLLTALFASCSQEEILSENKSGENGLVTVTVGMPEGKVNTRAMPEYDGFVRRCIMQVVNATSGVAIEGDGMRQTVPVEADKVSFTFPKPEEEYKVLFWADYVKGDISVENAYKTADLQNVLMSFNRGENVFNQPAADAFCGVLASGESSVVLKRPFTKVVLKTSTPADFEGYDEIAIGNFDVPDGYNVFNKTTAATKAIRLEKTTMIDSSTGDWTNFFVFAPVSEAVHATNMVITLTKSTDASAEPLKVTITELKLDDNMILNLDVKKEAEKVTVDVTFDDEFENGGSTPEQPETPGELAVGSYINAAGEVVTSETEAVAVVFAMAEGKTDNSVYGDENKAKAYAISLQNATGGRRVLGNLSSFQLELTADDYSGFSFDAALKTKLGTVTTENSALFGTYYAATLPELTGAKLSAWYIPSKAQLTDALVLDNAALKKALKEAHNSDYFIASSSVSEITDGTTYNTIICTMYDVTAETASTSKPQKHTTSVVIFPVLTIFE